MLAFLDWSEFLSDFPNSAAVREQLCQALEADLIGPFDRDPASEEILPLPPSRWYLAGFLAPQAESEPPEDPSETEQLGAGDDEDDGQHAPEEPEPKRVRRLPASIGLSLLLPPGNPDDEIVARVAYADYELLPAEAEPAAGVAGEAKAPKLTSAAAQQRWRRRPVGPLELRLPLSPAALAVGVELPGSNGARVVGQLATLNAPGLPADCRSLAVFLVNGRKPGERGRHDERYLFQAQLEVRFARGLLPLPNRRGEGSSDWDEQLADLQYRERLEWAVGHGVAAEPIREGERLVGARVAFIPRATVPRVETTSVPGVLLSMEDLAALPDGDAVRRALGGIAEEYGRWIEERRTLDVGTERRRAAQQRLLAQAAKARERIQEGVELVAAGGLALDAFRLANEAMAMAARRRSPERYEEGRRPEWRLFQLAFLLHNLSGLVRPGHPDREIVELIFFPTGGGKTEAYLGVVAFLLLLRRLTGSGRPDGGLGVTVLLRYTLRLLTLDQLGRAATLVCALEMLRVRDERLGDTRFAIGLWVGKSATANTLEEVARQITDYKNKAGASHSPFPLTSCPWCGRAFGVDSFALRPSRTRPDEVAVGCADPSCEFSVAKRTEGLPVLFVDEQIYRELPPFLIATVDKLAMLPWRGETGMLFGRAVARLGRRFFGPMHAVPPLGSTPLPEGLRPPELIVQDELHLISGPLGTMVGLYETAIEELCLRREGEKPIRPKILASTATARRAHAQARALFGREALAIFPPPGVDAGDDFFSRERPDGRLYLGVAAGGRQLKAILLRVYTALLGAAWRCAKEAPEAADAYLTLTGYFNSLRELGGMRRLVQDEVHARLTRIEERRPVDRENGWFSNRQIQLEPLELTSREPTARIAKAKGKLARPHAEDGVDVLLASNMISVGVDIERLGLMVVAGQPKSTSEYIQATSRVGRDLSRPGLVVTVYNVHRPRDRSYYERFLAYHSAFYRFVEAQSVTPFSGPALDRGLAAVLVAMARLGGTQLTPSAAAMDFPAQLALGQAAQAAVAQRAAGEREVDPAERERLAADVSRAAGEILDAWRRIVQESRNAAGARCYSPWDQPKAGKPILSLPLEAEDEERSLTPDEARFTAPTSMRDVERTVPLWIQRHPLGGKRDSGG